MKGTFFQKPLELQLFIEGESWRQGEPVQGTLTVKNHGSEAVPVQGIEAKLAYGKLKKVREKKPDAFEVFEARGFSGTTATSIPPGGSETLSWKFETNRNCKVTDTLSSLFLVYGMGSECEKLGQLQLAFHPSHPVQEFLKILQIRFRFVQKSQRATKTGVEVKLAPPDGKTFSNLELLVLHFYFDGDILEVEYRFQVKKLEANAVSMTMKKEEQQCDQAFKPSDYLLPSGRLNDEAFEAAMGQALALVSRV